jgi:hypothetical protein
MFNYTVRRPIVKNRRLHHSLNYLPLLDGVAHEFGGAAKPQRGHDAGAVDDFIVNGKHASQTRQQSLLADSRPILQPVCSW